MDSLNEIIISNEMTTACKKCNEPMVKKFRKNVYVKYCVYFLKLSYLLLIFTILGLNIIKFIITNYYQLPSLIVVNNSSIIVYLPAIDNVITNVLVISDEIFTVEHLIIAIFIFGFVVICNKKYYH